MAGISAVILALKAGKKGPGLRQSLVVQNVQCQLCSHSPSQSQLCHNSNCSRIKTKKYPAAGGGAMLECVLTRYAIAPLSNASVPLVALWGTRGMAASYFQHPARGQDSMFCWSSPNLNAASSNEARTFLFFPPFAVL
jgi:hypothetical protein